MPKVKRILLVYPPYKRLYSNMLSTDAYPLSLGSLVGVIMKETRWDVMVYNADFVPHGRQFPLTYFLGEGFRNYLKNLDDVFHPAWKDVRSTINDFKPSIVGIYCCSALIGCVRMVAKLAKEYDQATTVIVGGPHPSAIGIEMLDDPNIDVSVLGEGERTMVDILQAIDDGKPFSGIKGIIYRDGQRIVDAGSREYVDDLDSFGSPYEYVSRVLKDHEKFPKSAFQFVMTTRGCKDNCLFCGSRYVFGRKIRHRSVKEVTEELKFLVDMGIHQVSFLDDTFTLDKEYTRQLCNSIIRNLRGLRWSCVTRADAVDDRTLALMKKAGCREIAIGIESGNNEMLRKMRKRITLESALDAARLIRKNRINFVAFFMIGFPGETEKTINDTLTAMRKINGKIIFNVFTPFPGTQGFEMCRQLGLIKNDYNPALFMHQGPENYFCMDIEREKFKKLENEVADFVDTHNLKHDLGNAFTLSKLRQIYQYGFRETLRRLEIVLRRLIK
jgi:anaerobic magnesium-protoporphyrin IX monomethyl ester cyclase